MTFMHRHSTNARSQVVKILLTSMMIIFSINLSYAGNRHEGRHEGRYEGRHEARSGGGHDDFGRWFGPALIGGFLGYALASPRTVFVQPAPQPIVVMPESTYSWSAPQPIYKEVVEYSPSCNCYMHILRQIGWR